MRCEVRYCRVSPARAPVGPAAAIADDDERDRESDESDASHNVTRWRNGKMIVRWVAVGILKAAKGFRRLKGCTDMPKLVRARGQQLALVAAAENVA